MNAQTGEVASEGTQPQFIRYEDHFQSLTSRCERLTHILESMVNNLNGAEPPELQPTSTSDKPEPPRDELPMLGRMDRVADNAFDAMNKLERQFERLQSLQLI